MSIKLEWMVSREWLREWHKKKWWERLIRIIIGCCGDVIGNRESNIRCSFVGFIVSWKIWCHWDICISESKKKGFYILIRIATYFCSQTEIYLSFISSDDFSNLCIECISSWFRNLMFQGLQSFKRRHTRKFLTCFTCCYHMRECYEISTDTVIEIKIIY